MNSFPILIRKKVLLVVWQLIKLDLEKSYDFLNWNYIRTCLIAFGFSEHWIKLIMQCISSVSFSVLINGSA